MTANPRSIRSERFDEIGAILRRDATLLVERWARRAVQEQPSAARVHHNVLLDHLPGFLVDLGAHLAEESDAYGPHRRRAALHGGQRWQVGRSLAEVVRDYGLLRLVVLEYLEESLDRPLRLRESQAVGLAFDDAIEAGVEQYVRSRDEELRRIQEAHAAHTRQAEEELHRWRKVFLDANWGVGVSHPTDHRLLAVNPAFARMHRYEVEELPPAAVGGRLRRLPDQAGRARPLAGPARQHPPVRPEVSQDNPPAG